MKRPDPFTQEQRPSTGGPERERHIVALRAASPMRGRAGQHDASDLGLFRAANEPRLL